MNRSPNTASGGYCDHGCYDHGNDGSSSFGLHHDSFYGSTRHGEQQEEQIKSIYKIHNNFAFIPILAYICYDGRNIICKWME